MRHSPSAAKLGTAALRKGPEEERRWVPGIGPGTQTGKFECDKVVEERIRLWISWDALLGQRRAAFTVHIHVPVLMMSQNRARPAWVRTLARSVRTMKTSTCIYCGCHNEYAALEHLGFWYLARGHFGSALKWPDAHKHHPLLQQGAA